MSTSNDPSSQVSLAKLLIKDALHRVRYVSRRAESLVILALSSIPAASAQDPLYNAAPPNSVLFTPTAVPPNSTWVPDAGNIQDDINHESGWFYMSAWDNRGRLIRQGGGPNSTQYCLGNLSLALHELGTLNSAEYAGAAGALSLLPTAGALIGSPTKELWVVYKLMPLAGVLSMFLSLGGTMVPTQAGAYDPKVSFTYGGMMATTDALVEKKRQQEYDDARLDAMLSRRRQREKQPLSIDATTVDRPQRDREDSIVSTIDQSHRQEEEIKPAELFAKRVERRAQDDGGGMYRNVWIGVGIQAMLIAVILIALWFGQIGGIITWWCDVYAWMWFWYFLVVLASMIENIVGVPFTHNWTLRIAKAPGNIEIGEDAPVVEGSHGKDVLATLKAGFNATSVVHISNEKPFTKRNSCFYVVISQEGVEATHATFRVLSKACNVAVFAFGTTLFASATLVSVSVALMVLALVLSAGVWGRVTAMWIASQMNKYSDPVLHTVVPFRTDAAEHMQEILKLPGLIIETCGHIIVNGRAIKRRNPWLSAARYIGLLAAPFDITTIAINGPTYASRGGSDPHGWSGKGPHISQNLLQIPSGDSHV